MYFDKIIYIDWDLLAKDNIRVKLDKYYVEKNVELLKYIPRNKIPDNYIKKNNEKTY